MEGAAAVPRATDRPARHWLRWAGILLVVLAVVAAIAYTNEDVGIAIGPSCTIGVTGTAATLTVKGWQSQRLCDTFNLGGNIALYRYSGQVMTPTVCQYRMEGLLFTVNDEGVLKVIGNLLCAALRSRALPRNQTP